MTSSHDTALDALDGFWSVIRAKADADPAFAHQLVAALHIPIEFRIEPPVDTETFKAVHPYISPRVLAEKGETRFREYFDALTDAQKKTVIKNNNFASPDAIGRKRGSALVDILWAGAKAQADRMAGR